MSLHSGTEISSEYSIDHIKLASGPPQGVSFEGSVVRISETVCAEIAEGDIESILVTYSMVGQYGSEIPKTAVFSLSTTRDGFTVSSHSDHEATVNNGDFCFDLTPKASL